MKDFSDFYLIIQRFQCIVEYKGEAYYFMKRKRKTYLCSCVVVCLLLYAYFARWFAKGTDNILLETVLQLSRHLIHIGLILVWMVSVRQRILQKSIRRNLLLTGSLLIFWLYIRTVKWMFFTKYSWQNRYCWYSYYIPIVLVPLLGVFLIQYLGKKENYELNGKTKLLYIPAIVLIGLVFTNDIHRFVFQFPEGIYYADSQYTYGIRYFMILGWSVCLGSYFVVMLLLKCRAPGKHWVRKLPLSVLILEVVLAVLYCLKVVTFDLTAVNCMMIVLLLESCIRSGLIRSNSNYGELFQAASIEAEITDRNGKVCYSSEKIKFLKKETRELMKAPENAGIIYDSRRLNSAEITNGRVFWWENISKILEYKKELEKIGERLSEKNDLLKAEMKLREKQIHVREKNRLYDQIVQEVLGEVHQLERLLKSENAKNRIAQICVLSAYIKRRSNLRILAENESELSAGELELCLQESLESIRLCGIYCTLDCQCEGKTKTEYMIALYDCVQQILEQILPAAESLLMRLRVKDNTVFMRVQADISAEKENYGTDVLNISEKLYNSAWIQMSGTIKCIQEENTLWFTLGMGGTV